MSIPEPMPFKPGPTPGGLMELTINGVRRQVPEHATLLQALRLAGVEVPTLCHDDRLKPAGVCRLCLVEVAGSRQLWPACHTLAQPGMDVFTHTPELEETRRATLELLAESFPEPGAGDVETPLLRWFKHYGLKPGGLFSPEPRSTPAFCDDTHPYIHVDMNRCIHCQRCVRICGEVQGQNVWHVVGRGAETSIIPDRGQTLLESSCVSCGACVDTCPSGALLDQSVLASGPATHWTRTTCPYCGTGCEMEVGTREGRIVQVRPALDAPVNHGHLCVKGRYAHSFGSAPDRVTHPMIREDGEWRRVAWPEALRFIATRLTELVDEFGPDSIGVLGSARSTNEENYLAQKFARVVLGTNNVDCCARVCHAPTAVGMKLTLGTGAATNSFADIEVARCFLICGCNPTENHPIVGARIKRAVRQGAGLIVIDPRVTGLAALADVHLRPRPGTNVPLLNALAQVLVAEGRVDESSLRSRVSGWENYSRFIQSWTPERAELITGVPAEAIRRAAHLYESRSPSMSFHGLGVTEHTQGTEGVMGLVNLALLTGNLGRPGSGVNPLRGQNNVQGSAHMGCEPGHFAGYAPVDQACARFEELWQAPLPRQPGLNLMQMLDAAGRGRLKALWAMGYDVALTNPDARNTASALARLDLIVVQDLFLNELARKFAHVFLPACSSFEKDGTFMNSERRVQRVRRVLEAPGEARADGEVLCAVAREMGFAEEFAYDSAEAVWNEVRQAWPAGAGLSYARLERGGLQWPCPTEEHPGTAILHTETPGNGHRPPLQCLEFKPSAEVTNDEYPFLLTTGRTLYQFNAGTMTSRTPNVRLRGTDTLDLSPHDAVRLGVIDGEQVRLASRHGEAVLPVRVDARIRPGELFATFHTVESYLNRVIGSGRDPFTLTPEYKVVAVNVSKL